MSGMTDFVFVTIDCWRDDALRSMPEFRSYTANSDWERTAAIATSSNTSNTFPALFGASYYPQVWMKDGTVNPDIPTLPEKLNRAGYSTAGFIASNPWLSRWRDEFDTFWNGGIEDSSRLRFGLERARNLLQLKPLIPAETVLQRAQTWWENTDPPRFLWVHLMEPHKPYLPGVTRGLEIGPVLSPLSLAAAPQYDDTAYPKWLRQHSRSLYKQAVRRLDTHLTPWLQTLGDTPTVITADHGEEFDHGIVSHKQLYDETVRVPLLTNSDIGQLTDGLTRQIDIAPTILRFLGLDPPTVWEGTEAAATVPPQHLLCGPDDDTEKIWAGIRTEGEKLVNTYDYDWNVINTEFYQLASDPDELYPKPKQAAPTELLDAVSDFVSRPEIQEPLQEWYSDLGTIETGTVESRLEDLGYL
ncbi:sulfatase-like hydrolase/transferase [Haloarcula sp. H-GB4]|uniref:sulfatase-like hydrolase/transferase n=1 Tax=Haloarcula sp. H-GB4 TaxID=3069755 RepID=UPI0027B608BE|nr:sulfatase-like hydrolase/transferase [Haloarcula sp. H-GB4]MDQ2072315.1 sulfatase-like hydrolase/transferase [Haloarcula sp. H-GB4]